MAELKRAFKTSAAAGFALIISFASVGGNAVAEERQFGYAMTMTAASDYMFRGISYTDNDPTVNIYNEVSYGIAYLAFWTSTIDYYPYGNWEQDVYIGFRPVTGPVSWDVSANYYMYGNKDKGQFGSTSDIAYAEFKIGASIAPVDNLTLGALVWLTPDQGYAATENISYEATASYKLQQVGVFSPTLSGLVGRSNSGTNEYYPDGYWVGHQSYTYWNAGLKLDVEKFFMDFRYWDTTINDPLTNGRFVFSVGVNLLP